MASPNSLGDTGRRISAASSRIPSVFGRLPRGGQSMQRTYVMRWKSVMGGSPGVLQPGRRAVHREEQQAPPPLARFGNVGLADRLNGVQLSQRPQLQPG